MKVSTKKEIRNRLSNMTWAELLAYAKDKQEWLENIAPTMHVVSDCGANIRNWVKIEVACYELEFAHRRLGRIAKFEAHKWSRSLIDDTMLADGIF